LCTFAHPWHHISILLREEPNLFAPQPAGLQKSISEQKTDVIVKMIKVKIKKIMKIKKKMINGQKLGRFAAAAMMAVLVSGLHAQAPSPGGSGPDNSTSTQGSLETLRGQQAQAQAQTQKALQAAATGSPLSGSLVVTPATKDVMQLTLDQAIQLGLQHNLGYILQSESAQSANGSRLQQLQPLLPTVTADGTVSAQQVNLVAEGFRFNIPGFPKVIGPFGVTDIRGYLTQNLINVNSLENYLAAKHNFQAEKLSADDVRNLVALSVGNAYLVCLADAANVDSQNATVNASKLSEDQANSNHEAGTAPKLDLLRAQVDYQSAEQQQITAVNQLAKDKLALLRAIGISTDQKFELADKAPFNAFDTLDADTAVAQALKNRKDLQADEEQVKAADLQKKAATADRLPVISFKGDYGDIGVNPSTSHGTVDAEGKLEVPILDEARLRGEHKGAQSVLVQKQAQLNDARNQVDADVRDSLLDIASAARLVTAADANRQMSSEALDEARERYKAGVSDNLAVSEALAQFEQANLQYIAALYQHNVAKLSLARALGVAAGNYKDYLGGK
jgi:outer membrane protein TolC